MKKILNGVRFDTEKAVKIGEYDNIGYGADSITDFNFWEASLYRTPRSGRYFLAGEGGALSRFGTAHGQNSWGGGADIVPLSRQEALEWAEQYLDAGIVENEFADMIEDA